MAKKGNRILYKLVNKETGTFYVVDGNRINGVPETLKKFDKKTGKHEVFEVKRYKKK